MFYGADARTLRAAVKLRKNMTLAELILWKKLKDRKIVSTKFRRQHPIDIFIVDFYCHEYKLVIEIDGEIHNNKEIIEYDLARTNKIKKFGIRVVRFTNYQIIFKMSEVIIRIKEVLAELAPKKSDGAAKSSPI